MTEPSVSLAAEPALASSDDRVTIEAPPTTIGSAEIAAGTVFAATQVGGLSGLTFDPVTGTYLAISDDRGTFGSPRLYELGIDVGSGTLGLQILDVRPLTTADFATLEAVHPDGEGIAVGASGEIYVASERDFLGNPAIYRLSPEAVVLGGVPVDEKYQPAWSPGEQTSGVRDNYGFESLTISPDGATLYTATEAALVQDGPLATVEDGSTVRIVRYDLTTGLPAAEFAYEVGPVHAAPVPPGGTAETGLSELLALDDQGTLLALEGSFSEGVGDSARLYLVETAGATDVSDLADLAAGDFQPVSKELLLDLGSLGIPIGNLEGMTLGPVLPDGRQSLVLVSDNDFTAGQPTRVIALALDLGSEPAVGPAGVPDGGGAGALDVDTVRFFASELQPQAMAPAALMADCSLEEGWPVVFEAAGTSIEVPDPVDAVYPEMLI